MLLSQALAKSLCKIKRSNKIVVALSHQALREFAMQHRITEFERDFQDLLVKHWLL